MDDVRISCVMTVYRGSGFMTEAITSLVEQSLPPAEIIVIGDGCTDDSCDRALAAGRGLVRVIRRQHEGLDAARNAGRAEATGDYLHFFDEDDILPAGSYAAMHRALAENPSCDAVFGRWRNFWITELAHEAERAENAHLLGEQSGLMLTAGLLRRALMDRAPAFPIEQDWSGSTLWMAELARAGARFARIDRMVLDRRVHFTNMSRKKTLDGLFDLTFRLKQSAKISDKTRKSSGARTRGD